MTRQQPIAFIPERLATLKYWITEREQMRRKHDANAASPWSRDPHMASARWCNVRRMDDKVSRWLMRRWYTGRRAKPHNAMAAATLARYVNWPDSLAELLDVPQWDWHSIRAILNARKARGEKVFTGAYKVPCGGRYETRDKIELVVDIAAEVDDIFFHLQPRSMRKTWDALCHIDGVGPFLGGQIVADLRHVVPGSWADKDTWAPLGPGSEKGMLYLLGRDATGSLSQVEFERHLPSLCDYLRQVVPDICKDRQLEAMDVQNCLCEVSKLARLLAGGRAKNRYQWRGAKEEAQHVRRH